MAVLAPPEQIADIRGRSGAPNSNIWDWQPYSKVVARYALPLLVKWHKTFPSPTLLLITEFEVDTGIWAKRFKASQVKTLTWSQACREAVQTLETFDMIVLFQPVPQFEQIETVLSLLKKSGAFLLICQNGGRSWEQWQTKLTSLDLGQLFAMGFHPQGTVTWWPFNRSLGLGLDTLVDILTALFPNRHAAAFRWGKCWMIRAIKQEYATQLT